MTLRHTTRRYGLLMALCRKLAAASRTVIDRQHYERLRDCLWARYQRELRHSVLRH